jgi:hypothetical protein
MSAEDAAGSTDGVTLGAPAEPDESRGGPNVEAAIANAEEGSVVEGVHTLPGEDEDHDSRVEQMPEVEGVTEGRAEGTPGGGSPPKPGPSPADTRSS